MRTLFRHQSSTGQRGAGLIEAIVAIAILAVVMVTVLKGISTFQISAGKNSEQAVAENLVRNQMEYIFQQPYLSPLSAYAIVAPPGGYTVAAEALEFVAGDPNIELVRVTVFHRGQEKLAVETLRSNY